MEIRGAGRIATAAAASLKEYALSVQAESLDDLNQKAAQAADLLLKTRPTAVSLSNAIRMVMKYEAEEIDDARQAIASNADRFKDRPDRQP